MNPLILLAEDEDDLRSALSLILAREGYRVVEARTGIEAVEAATEWYPDVILMDLAMPGLNGLDAAQILKENPYTARIPLIVTTASWLGRDQETLKAVGFEDALLKPFAPPALLAVLRRALASRHTDLQA